MSDLHALRQQMGEAFDLGEIKSLCFDLEINYDELPGDRLGLKIISLLVASYKTGKTKNLHQLLVNDRPTFDWPNVNQLQAFNWLSLSSASSLTSNPLKGNLIYVPEKVIQVPSDDPSMEVVLKPFHISEKLISNKLFSKYIQSQNLSALPDFGWSDGNLPSLEQEGYPITGVTWIEARNFCKWLSQESQQFFSLPSEIQWQTAMVGKHTEITNGQIEWTTTLWGKSFRTPDRKFSGPWQPNSDRDDISVNMAVRRVICGGDSDDLFYRDSELPTSRGFIDDPIGFRVVLNQ